MIEHEIKSPTEYEYGYLNWRNKEKNKYKKIFPQRKFNVVFEGRKILNRKVDWEKNRLNLYPIKDSLNKGDVLLLQRKEGLIYIEKKNK